MKIVLASAQFQRRGSRGEMLTHRRGDLIDLADDEANRLVTLGIAVGENDAPPEEIPSAVPPAAPAPVSEPESTGDGPKRPSPAMNREKWDAYARAVGVDPGKFKSKQELIAALP
ncbi:hypothetical protein [Corynebacterium variabile]|uniref:hypothetical protein n=1 Tax=Corynebacterium variabile TaxID=1727 RepID=UPI003A922D8B